LIARLFISGPLLKISGTIRAGVLLMTAGTAFAQTSPAGNAPPTPEPPAVWSKPAESPNDSLVSPEVAADGRVTFRLYAPEAKRVTIRVNSDFGQGPFDFTKDEKGVWSVTTGPVPAGAYRYHFMVDGMTVPDNRNPSTSPGALNVQSVVEIPGGADEIQATRAGIPHGTLSTVYYDSPVSRGQRRLHLYLPPDYEKGKDYPVLYLIHGGGDDDEAGRRWDGPTSFSITSSRPAKPSPWWSYSQMAGSTATCSKFRVRTRIHLSRNS
jgi:enterochelin esterase family protein